MVRKNVGVVADCARKPLIIVRLERGVIDPALLADAEDAQLSMQGTTRAQREWPQDRVVAFDGVGSGRR